MLTWSIIFALVSVVAGIFGVTGICRGSAGGGEGVLAGCALF
jgi:uncharacterized membrane protein YtjA (UPF0391 family)